MAKKTKTNLRQSKTQTKLLLLFAIIFAGIGIYLVSTSLAGPLGYKVKVSDTKYGSPIVGKITDSKGGATTMAKPDGSIVYAVFTTCRQKVTVSYQSNPTDAIIWSDGNYYVQNDPNSGIKEDGTFTTRVFDKSTAIKWSDGSTFFDQSKPSTCTADLWAYQANKGQLGAVRSVTTTTFTVNP